MAIFINPNYTPNSAYQPNEFRASRLDAVNVVEYAIITPTINGVVQTAFTVPYYDVSPANTYLFKADLQKLLQAKISPFASQQSEVFGTLDLPYQNTVNDVIAEYSIDVEYLYRDATTGLLVNAGVTESSVNYYAVSGTRQSNQDKSFNAYKMQAATPNTVKWLTNAPTTQQIADNENAFLCHIEDAAADRCRITTYDSAGVQIGQGSFAIDTDANEVNTQSIGVGIANLATQVYLVGAVTLPDPNAAYYVVQLWNSAVPFIDFIEPRTFEIVQNCSDSVRIHWFNLLGGADAYTFKKLQRKDDELSYTVATRPSAWELTSPPYNPSQFGTYKLQTRGVTTYEAQSDPLTPSEAEWLSEIAKSAQVYREDNGTYIPIVVTTTTTPIEKDVNGELNLVFMTITFQDSNELIIQHT